MELQFKLKTLNFTDVAKLCHLASPGVLALFSLQMLPETSKICPQVQLVLPQIRFCFSGNISRWSIASAHEILIAILKIFLSVFIISDICYCFTDTFSLPDYTRCINGPGLRAYSESHTQIWNKKIFSKPLPPTHTCRNTQSPSTYDFFLILKIEQSPF